MPAETAAASRVTRNAAPRFAGRFVPRSAAVLVFLMLLITSVEGQAPFTERAVSAAMAAKANSAPAAAVTPGNQIRLMVGQSTLIQTNTAITRVSLTTPDVADAMVTSPQQLLVHGKAPGTISLFVWDRGGNVDTYEVMVERDLTLLAVQVRSLFPGEPIEVAGSGKDIVLSGEVSSKYVVEKAAEVAAGYVEKKENVVNLLRQEEGAASNQVLLRVRFAEVSRSALQELGVSLFADGRDNTFGRTTTQQFPAPIFDQQAPMLGKSLVFSDYLNLFLFDAAEGLGAVVKALQTKGLFQSLAEPNLIAQNGKEATFLAGGEYPYPAVQGAAGNLGITIVFKEFGIRLTFTPSVLRDDVIHLKVKPEVSALDFTNAVSLQGFRVPSLTTRRAETEVELRDGQTFAIAGLLNNTLTESMQKIPGIGDIPILGLLFRSRALQKAETELVVMITPQILRRNSTGVSDRLPNLHKEFMRPEKDTIPPPPPYTPKQPEASLPGGAPVADPVAEPRQTSEPVVARTPADMMPRDSAKEPPSLGAAGAARAPERPTSPAVQPRDQQESIEGARKAAGETRARSEADLKKQREADARQARIDAERMRKQAEADRARAQELARASAAQAERDMRAARQQAELDKKREKAEAEAAARKAEEDRKREKAEAEVAARKAEEDKKIAERQAREVARKNAEAAKRDAEYAKIKAENEKKRAKDMSEAAARLREAQAAYEAELQRVSKLTGASQAKTPPEK